MGNRVKGAGAGRRRRQGAYQVGAYQALQEVGWQPDIITGTSVGCLNGVLFVLGKVREAVDLWKSWDIHGVLEVPQSLDAEGLRSFLLGVVRGGGLDLEPLGETIDRYLDEDAVRAAPVRYGLVMTELNTLKSIQCPIEQIPAAGSRNTCLPPAPASRRCARAPSTASNTSTAAGATICRWTWPPPWARRNWWRSISRAWATTAPTATGLPTRVVRSHWDLGPMFDFDCVRAARNIALGYLDTLRAFGRVGGTAYALLPDKSGFPWQISPPRTSGFCLRRWPGPRPCAGRDRGPPAQRLPAALRQKPAGPHPARRRPRLR